MEGLGQHPTTACSTTSTAGILPAKATFHHAPCMILLVLAIDVLQAQEYVAMVW